VPNISKVSVWEQQEEENKWASGKIDIAVACICH